MTSIKKVLGSMTLLLTVLCVLSQAQKGQAETQANRNPIGVRGITSNISGKNGHNDAQKTERSKVVYDIYGKRLRADEKYIAERTLESGRIVAYRRNKREIAALVKALKEDGVTDEKLLDANTWLMQICQNTSGYGCNGGCGLGTSCKAYSQPADKVTIHGHLAHPLDYCACGQ